MKPIDKQASLMDLFKRKPWYRDAETVSLIKALIPVVLAAGGVGSIAAASIPRPNAPAAPASPETGPKNEQLLADIKEVVEMLRAQQTTPQGHSGDSLSLGSELEAGGEDLGQPDNPPSYMYPLS
jgi:hypothetical protein